MATKLKNFLYNPIVKFVAILLMLCSVAVMTTAIFQFAIVEGAIGEENFFGTREFYYDYGRLSHNAIEKHLVLIDEDNILENSDSSISNGLIRRFRTIEENLNGATSFIYVLENTDTGEIISNIDSNDPVAVIESKPTSLLYEYDSIYFPEGSNLDTYASDYLRYNISSYLNNLVYLNEGISDILNDVNAEENNNWRYYTALTDAIQEDDSFFYDDYQNFERFHANESLIIVSLTLSSIMILVCLLYLTFVVGRQRHGSEAVLLAYDEIPHELQLMITGALFAPLGAFLGSVHIESIVENKTLWMLVLFAVIAATGVVLEYLSLVRLLKARQFFSKLAIVRFFKYLVGLVQLPRFDRTYRIKIAIWLMMWLVVNALCFVVMVDGDEGPFIIGFGLIIVFNVIVLRRIYKLIDDLRAIMNSIHNRRMGITSEGIEVEGLTGSLVTFVDDLEALQEGLDVAVEEQIRGEKLKTELITNVTHDLKNPLTSIISYVELLKTKDVYDDETMKYIGVLDEKANRLKGLIDQLVDASKASSGNVDVNMETVDLVQLSRQLCGEFSDKLEKESLHCLLPEFEEPILVEADPMVLYRILENLMSNVCKYSLAGTRVYVDIQEGEGGICYAIKNISKEALNMEVENLSRRFVRGDSSRNTEGSGLGLSIALSLSKLIGAKLRFDIDGDLFKAILTLKEADIPE